ncbi:MAG: hypothetical protein H6922_04415 [Pseudomonadaceae bacterium]|nr:hypothetical protein [Pseudomonadaceae bacterium]
MTHRLAFATALLLAVSGSVATAQTRAANDIWPRTFTGQPDFEFSKADALADRNQSVTAEGGEPFAPPTLADLLDDETVNPLAIPTAADEEAGTATPAQRAKLPAIKLDNTSLPAVSATRVDTSAFKESLQRIIQHKVNDFVLQQGRYSLDHVIRRLTLQAVVTSPVKYAVIDGRRYHVGESFLVPVYAGPSQHDLLIALAANVPASGGDDGRAEGTAPYKVAYDEVVKALVANMAGNPRALQRRFNLPATVVDIQHRKVLLDFNGQRHELVIRYAY